MYFTKSEANIVKFARKCKAEGLKIGLTHGCYDLFHTGHLAHLLECKKVVDILLVGVESDKNIKIFKDVRRPIVSQRDRCQIVEAITVTDFAFVNDLEFSENSYRSLYKKLGIETILYGPEFGAEKYILKRAQRLGIKSHKTIIHRKNPVSTTGLINKILIKYSNGIN